MRWHAALLGGLLTLACYVFALGMISRPAAPRTDLLRLAGGAPLRSLAVGIVNERFIATVGVVNKLDQSPHSRAQPSLCWELHTHDAASVGTL